MLNQCGLPIRIGYQVIKKLNYIHLRDIQLQKKLQNEVESLHWII